MLRDLPVSLRSAVAVLAAAVLVRVPVAAGDLTARSGTKKAMQTGPQPLLAQPPNLAQSTNPAGCTGECAIADPPFIPVSEEKNPPLGYDKPTGRPIRMGRVATGAGSALEAAAPEQFQIWRTASVVPAIPANPPGAPGYSPTNEPSLAASQDVMFYTGNWYAALSGDHGLNWRFINPFDNFPSDGTADVPGTSSGFCCDQVVLYERSRDLMIWFLQYATPRDGAGNRTATNVQRLAWAVGRQNLLANNWFWVDFTVSDFGFSNANWLDFPDLQVSSNYLYFTTNVFTLANAGGPAVIARIPLDNLRDNTPVTFSYLVENASFRMCSGCTDTLYWARHVDNDTIRIFGWNEASSGVTLDDVDHVAFNTASTSSPYVATSPDGTNWAGFGDNRILGAYRANGELGFLYGSRQNPPLFPYPYVDVSKFRESDRGYLTTEPIYSTQYGILYPSVAINARGDRGGTLVFGGGSTYPSVAAYVADQYNNFDFTQLNNANYTVATGSKGPAGNRWGDYLTARLSWTDPYTWVASGYTLDGSGVPQPMFAWFSRERDRPQSEVAVTSVAVDSACHSVGTPMSVSVSLRNYGMTDATIPLVECRISADGVVDLGDAVLTSAGNVVVPANTQVTLPLSAATPSRPAGQYRVGAWLPFFVDPVIDNNQRMASTIVGIGPAPEPAPFINQDPDDIAVCPGGRVETEPVVSSVFPPMFLWKKNGVAWRAQSVPTLSIPAATRDDSGVYQLVASNQCGTAESREAIVAVGVFLRRQPADQSAAPCAPATFSVEAYGTGGLAYQWRHNGVALGGDERIGGVNAPTLTIHHVRYEDEGRYDCVVTDACGPVTSTAATLTLSVTPPWAQVPMNASPNISTPGMNPPPWSMAYDARRGVTVLYGGLDIRGYPTNHLWEYDGVEWTVRQNGANGTLLNVGQQLYDNNWPPAHFALVFNPDDGLMYLVGDASWYWPMAIWTWDGQTWRQPYYGPATGGHNTYQAVYDQAHRRIVIVRESSTPYVPEMLIYDPAAGTMSGPTVFSPPVEKGVYHAHLVYDERRGICLWYQNDGVGYGPPTMWAFEGANWTKLPGTPINTYAGGEFWQYDPVAGQVVSLAGAYVDANGVFTGTYRFPGVSRWATALPPADDWELILPDGPPRNPAGTGLSPVNSWVVRAMSMDPLRRAMVALGFYYVPPDFTTIQWRQYERRYLDRVVFDRQPAGRSLVPGSPVRFSVVAAGCGALSYQWKRNGLDLADGPAAGGGSLSGATSNALTIDPAGAADAGIYTCRVSNPCGSALSRQALLGPAVAPDLDGDGDVDGDDLLLFTACASGPAVPPGALTCNRADFDHDGDVDTGDFGRLQRCLGGAGILPLPGCEQ